MQLGLFALCLAFSTAVTPAPSVAQYMDLEGYGPVEAKMKPILRSCVDQAATDVNMSEGMVQCSSTIMDFCQRTGPQKDSNWGMKGCASATAKLLDGEVNRVWASIKKRATSAEFKDILAKQRAWLRYREDEASAEAAQYEGGTHAGLAYWISYISQTSNRLARLYQILGRL